MPFDSVATLISDAVVEVGIVTASAPATSGDIADPYASGDQNVLQLLRLLKKLGRQLLRERKWTALIKEYTFVTSGLASYPVPADFLASIDDTVWDRSTSWPAGGPVNSEEYQAIQGFPVLPFTTVRFWQNKLYVIPTTSTGETLAYEYVSSSWVAVAASTTPTKEAPTLKDDVVLFDSHLVGRGLALEWKKAKGFDTNSEQVDFDRALQLAKENDTAARTLWIGRSRPRVRMIDGDNLPPTGWGH